MKKVIEVVKTVLKKALEIIAPILALYRFIKELLERIENK